MNISPYLLGIDWGTTNRRAYLLDVHGALLNRHEDGMGILACQGDFGGALDALLARWPGVVLPGGIVMAGMIGSRNGWVEAPYLPVALRLDTLPRHLMRVPHALHALRIVPGVCDDSGPDVMRGEETQVLGAWRLGGGDGLYVLPGTHSKWVHVQDGCITGFRTFMTGELFATLRREGTLATLLGGGQRDDATAFAAGVARAGAGVALSRALFGLRAAVLLGQIEQSSAAAWLSGLLIGAEWHDPAIAAQLAAAPTVINIVGEPALAERHARTAALQGIVTRSFLPEEVFLAALATLKD